MATKKASARRPVTQKRQTATSSKAASVIGTGISKLNLLKTFGNFGAASLFAGYLLIYTLPQQSEHAIKHGERAIEKISSAVDRLGDKFQTVQGTTQGKQDLIIDRQDRIIDGIETTNRLLSGQIQFDPVTKIGIHPMPFPNKNEKSSSSQ